MNMPPRAVKTAAAATDETSWDETFGSDLDSALVLVRFSGMTGANSTLSRWACVSWLGQNYIVTNRKETTGSGRRKGWNPEKCTQTRDVHPERPSG